MAEIKKLRWKLCWGRKRKCSGGAFIKPRKKTWKQIPDKRQKVSS